MPVEISVQASTLNAKEHHEKNFDFLWACKRFRHCLKLFVWLKFILKHAQQHLFIYFPFNFGTRVLVKHENWTCASVSLQVLVVCVFRVSFAHTLFLFLCLCLFLSCANKLWFSGGMSDIEKCSWTCYSTRLDTTSNNDKTPKKRPIKTKHTNHKLIEIVIQRLCKSNWLM